MSNSNAYLRSAPFIAFKFVDDDLSGRVNDSYGVSIYHIYSSRGVLGNLKSTTLTRSATGETVAEIQWGGLTRQRRAIIHGRDCGKLLKSDVDWLKLLGSRKFCFHDEAGSAYYWKKEEASGPI
ncbi:hypothetical protein FRC00_009291 [Tulasnella sp. 408]|nr:hypothetical protein FRC00_009291 [Tulasnella sp. 408]